MSILEMVKKFGSDKGEDAMWKSVKAMSKYAEQTKDEHKEEYECLMRKVYEAMCGEHYDDEMAECDLANISYSDSSGKIHNGPHWTKDEVVSAWSGNTFDDDVTDADKWVAANAMYADLCKSFNESQALDAAYLFFFKDEDWDGDGKVWAYMNM